MRSASSHAWVIIAGTSLAAALGAGAHGGGVAVVDLAVESGFQDTFFGHYNRGRTCIAADFDLDGWIDFYIGNVGDPSFVMRNMGPDGDGIVHFELVQMLLLDEVAWGAVATDYDGDDDYDLFITGGGNEAPVSAPRFCHLFRNLLSETGSLQFEEITDAAGVSGAIPPGETEPAPSGHANAVCGDYDQDGDTDILVSRRPDGPAGITNILWSNNGNGTFTDVTAAVGLDSAGRSQNSTFVDVDNDGDLDIYENNRNFELGEQLSILWANQLQETGTPSFVDVTTQKSAPGHALGHPNQSFASGMADFNNDGWQDLAAFKWGISTEEPVYGGHALFLNNGTQFANVADAAGVNNPFLDLSSAVGVMGCQLGDLNADGVVDWYFGNGGPVSGVNDQLFLSNTTLGPVGSLPQYQNASALIDFPAAPNGLPLPSYPYRTHGTVMVDVDNDGTLELAVVNGGPSWDLGTREPNRLFKFTWPTPSNWLKVRPVGDGVCVSRDAIGTRISLVVREGAGPSRQIFNTLLGGSAFCAQNGFEVYFGLEQADTIEAMIVRWPDGRFDTITKGLSINASIVIEREALVVGDITCDDAVGFADLSALLAAWGPCPPTGGCVADLDGGGGVGFTDLTTMLNNWG